MSFITMRATLMPEDLHRYMDKLDETGLPYSFVCSSAKEADPMVLELWLDDADHDGTEVRLNKNGTWSVSTLLVLGSET